MKYTNNITPKYDARDAKLEEAQERREALRAELHSYGAISAEPDLEGCSVQVESVAHSKELEDFMRKAGGLKHELLTLVQVCCVVLGDGVNTGETPQFSNACFSGYLTPR